MTEGLGRIMWETSPLKDMLRWIAGLNPRSGSSPKVIGATIGMEFDRGGMKLIGLYAAAGGAMIGPPQIMPTR